MSKLIVDDELRAKINGLNEDVEVCDSSGETLGYLLSPNLYKQLIFGWADRQISEDDWKRMSQSQGGRTLAEIWKTLDAK